MSSDTRKPFHAAATRLAIVVVAGAFVFGPGRPGAAATTPPSISVSQNPLTAAIPAHPQVLFSIANSESTDGTVAGAILTGSGASSGTFAVDSEFNTSSSPVNYSVPSGFCPPLTATVSESGACSVAANSSAPYTSSTTISSTTYEADNSPSRLNDAKEGIEQILETYLPVADFALEDYNVSSMTAYTTWVYYMSPSSGAFEFTNAVPQPAITLSLTSTSVTSGSQPTLTWSATNSPTSCTASESAGSGFSGTVAASGSVVVTPPTNTSSTPAITTYTLSCTISGETTTQSIDLTVYQGSAPSAIALSLSSSTVTSGSQPTLTWSATNSPTSCTASESAGSGFSGTVAASGSVTLTPPTNTSSTPAVTTYTLTCATSAGTTTQKIDLTVYPTSVPPTITLSLSSNPVTSGTKPTLTWSATNTSGATPCTASESAGSGFSGTKAASSSVTVTPPTNTSSTPAVTTYTLSCTNPGGTTTQIINLTVYKIGASAPPAIALSLSGNTVVTGSQPTLTWSATGSPTSCTATESAGSGFSGTVAASGSVTVTPPTNTSSTPVNISYTLTCTNSAGTSTQTIDVTVYQTSAPSAVALSLSPSAVTSGSTPTLTWGATNSPTSCSATESAGSGFSGTVAASGSVTVTPPTNTSSTPAVTTYTLTCTNSAGTTTQTIDLTVFKNLVPPTITLSLSPSTVGQGSTSVLNYSISGATACSTPTSSPTNSTWNGATISTTGGSVSLPALTNGATPAVGIQGPYTFTLTCSNSAGAQATQTTTSTITYLAGEEVANPCYGINLSGSTTLDSDCNSLNTTAQLDVASGGLADITTLQYIVVGNSSDDPSINDVLYASGIAPLCLVYGSLSPANPYVSYGLPTYESGGVTVTYSSDVPSGTCARETGPTNAGFVPFTPQTMYAQRGFGYIGNQSASSGSMVVPTNSLGTSSSNKSKIVSASQTPTSSSVTSALGSFGITQPTSTTYAMTPGAALAPETSSASTGDIKASGEQSPIAGLLATAYSYYQYPPATSNSCPAQQYVVLVTDGLPTESLAGNLYPPIGSQAAQASPNGYGVSATFNSDGSLNTSSGNDQPLNDTITELAALASENPETITLSNGGTQTVQTGVGTYVIGLGAGVQSSNNPQAAAALTAMAIAGGTAAKAESITSPSTAYFPATSPAALVSDLQAILQQIIGTSSSVAASAANSSSLSTGTFLYQASFSTIDTYQDWTGNLEALPITTSETSNTGILNLTPTWQAQPLLDTLAATVPTGETAGCDRVIATWQPTQASPAVSASGIPFEWVGSGSSSSTCNATAGIVSTSTLATAITSTTTIPDSSDTSGQDRVNYLRGNTTLEQRNSGVFRNRTHILGDIIDSNPLFVGTPNGPYQLSSYNSFISTWKNRTQVIYDGANDGMLHAFNAGTGEEMFAFIPNGVFANLPMLTSPFYNAQHHFFVDGSPQTGDVCFGSCASNGSNWHTLVVGGEGAGGQTIYALDVTNPAGITTEAELASSVLWEFSDPGTTAWPKNNMGYTYSQPVVAQITSSTSSPAFAVFFGNGYNSDPTNASGYGGDPFLYAVDPQQGTILAKINLCNAVSTACSSSSANGLSSVAVVNSAGVVSGPATTVYAGDLQGNLWRVDITDPNPANWRNHVSVLFQARDGSGNGQPITTAPTVALNPDFPRLTGVLVMFGTGQLLSVGDLSTTGTQTIYSVWDSGTLATYTRASNLTPQYLCLNSTTEQITVSTSSSSCSTANAGATAVVLSSTNRGWYTDLSPLGSGMRDVTNPQLEAGGVLVTTVYAPNTNECVGGGTTFALLQNFATGGGFPQGGQFTNPGGSSSSGSEVGFSLGSVFASQATFLNCNSCDKTFSLSSNSIQNVHEKPLGQARSGWWEIQ